MAQKDRQDSLLTAIWKRIKYALSNESNEYEAVEQPSMMARKMRYLERCLQEDCLTEKYRKQLEQQWQEVSH